VGADVSFRSFRIGYFEHRIEFRQIEQLAHAASGIGEFEFKTEGVTQGLEKHQEPKAASVNSINSSKINHDPALVCFVSHGVFQRLGFGSRYDAAKAMQDCDICNALRYDPQHEYLRFPFFYLLNTTGADRMMH
jgi:hypothetical protein